MPNRTFNAGDYRFGFNGKEADRNGEWGSLNHYDYGFRIYNPGLAKFLSVDPLRREYSELTPYQFAANKPIWAIDLDGLEPYEVNVGNGKTYPSSIPEESILVVKASRSREGKVKIHEPFERKCINCPNVTANNKELQDAAPGVVTASFEWDSAEGSIGDTEGASSYIPVYGAGRNAINDFQNNRYIGGTINSLIAVTDWMWVRSVLRGGAALTYASFHEKGIKYYLGVGYANTWGATKTRWQKMGMTNAPFNIFGMNKSPKHHAFIPQNRAGFWGNMMWNMRPFKSKGVHDYFAHTALGAARPVFNPPMRYFWTVKYQLTATPAWFRGAWMSYSLRNMQSTLNYQLNTDLFGNYRYQWDVKKD